MLLFIIAFFLTLVSIYIFGKIGIRFDLMDKPAGQLKPHERPIPYTGGMAILAGITPALFYTSPILFAVSGMWLVGFLDDRFGLPPSVRLILQLVTGFYLSFFVFNHTILSSFILAFMFAAIINAYNMIDGMDGICGVISFVSSLALIVGGLTDNIYIAFSAAILAFIFFNFPPARIFLGDQGSYIVGTVFGIALIQTYAGSNFSLVVAVLWLPVLDLILGFIRRIKSGKSPFSGDRDHFYDKLYRLLGNNKRATVLVASLMALVYSFSAIFFSGYVLYGFLIVLSIIQTFSLKSLKST
ncbi:MAG: undecaprenyl/decaprenyl-phosphate alpha-N-acetylglucosaminyl 1-phosphate transferase [Kosmotoga sp.]|nr:MAG: undecaprenyl/decaprenyl-phosphate alpha-N-acetylglucosaminyl 1-phosphate transferase [Kosmotoga sp.]